MESKEHKKKRKLNTKYSYMEKCDIRKTREKPYQLQYLEKLKELKKNETTTNNESKEDFKE